MLRVCRAAGAEQLAADAYDDVRRGLYLIVHDLVEKAYALVAHAGLKTLLPTHLDQAVEHLGYNVKAYLVSVEDVSIPKAHIVTAARLALAKHGPPRLRLSAAAIEQLLLIVGTILFRWVRSAVGLVAHAGRKRLEARDLKNIWPIAENCPDVTLYNPGLSGHYSTSRK